MIKITTLSENTAGTIDVVAEWGLSFLIEADGVNILMDSGQSTSMVHNAEKMGVDLTKIDKVVLSHGHYDHTGGLRHLLTLTGKKVEVIAHPDIWTNKYKHPKKGKDRYIGIPDERRELEKLGAMFRLTREPAKITENITTTGEIPMVTEYEDIDSGLIVKEGETALPEELWDDLALVIKSEAGLVVVLGCAHRGIINTIYHAQKITGVERVHAVVGGAHLINASDERIWLTISALKDLKVQKLALCHCTGFPAVTLMRQEFGEGFIFNNTGDQLELP